MRERLIELIGDALDDCGCMDCYECSYEVGNSCKAKMTADYLLDNGVIVPLCKTGDTVWACHKAYNGRIVFGEYKITSTVIDDNGLFFYTEREINKCSKEVSSYSIEDIGERIFLTKEEAEAKLAELGGKA